ncbi:MAG: alpha-ketoglutarate-dependent dioxygenase AlkB [Chitinophaga sp.]|uniref:alpha-ketoglutarate-dependent dioxygenase AlkB family protein n=1 Tax=Chitinophaga sp. TaxID=1869181 RepID=UPI0025C079C2|nr:alpha-ketoglutarate-dependent dioxygenase AlkB [Chitinophaga sp.]MBV8254568.1 alpha-ketoglutarate-dependent dioxygenase AlkB [Chitinophaga sp.]
MSLQGNIFGNDNTHQEIILEHGILVYYPQFFTPQESNQFYHNLVDTSAWKQESMRMYGREVLFPRLMAWYGDASSAYSFSGKTFVPQPWTDTLLAIRNRVSPIAAATFNSVLLNYYRNGNDSMGWHADDEPELGQHPVIASVNFGAARRFLLRYKVDHSRKQEILLQHGSLLIMKGELQHYWEHHVPKTSKPVAGRINLTFRYIHP